MSPATARSQYGLTDPILTEDNQVRCASWWAAYARLQPGSACGSQSVEAYHASGLRAALVATLPQQEASQKKAELSHLAPEQFFAALAEAVIIIGRQLQKLPAHALIDIPNKEDPVQRADARLRALGRSTASELWRRRAQIQRVDNGPDAAYVMRRSLLSWRTDDAMPKGGTYVPVPESDVSSSPAAADACVQMATETSGKTLLRLWQRLKIVSGRLASTYMLDFWQWKKHRYDVLVVLTGSAASSLWAAPVQLCPCLPFALSASCEHARVVQSLTLQMISPWSLLSSRDKAARSR